MTRTEFPLNGSVLGFPPDINTERSFRPLKSHRLSAAAETEATFYVWGPSLNPVTELKRRHQLNVDQNRHCFKTTGKNKQNLHSALIIVSK